MPQLLSEHACFGGLQRFYQHDSSAIGLPMRFSIYLPPGAEGRPLPVLFYLAGLTCTEETFAIKAGAQRVAAEEGLILVAPDTSPRGAQVPGEADSWDFGVGAGFYIDASQAPWSRHYRMDSYILELRELVLREFGADPARCGIFGHSMGGHGALTMALKHPELFRSVSAFAPIAAPSRCPRGEKAFTGYLGRTAPPGGRTMRPNWWQAARCASPAASSLTGHGRQVPARAAPSGRLRSGLPRRRPAADPAPPPRLRPRLLLHRQFRRRPPALPPPPARLSTRRLRRAPTSPGAAGCQVTA
ncbi:S-formylglutathione hydrolase [Massilia sp. Dwa41.01b]|uniref:S-formylglutathione hydrolase n=1 Tax=Massilia sp. Dwa41.01b TaxID=2709302 RepID=UPI0035A6B03D